MLGLEGKRALVTGASSGIGRAVALALARAGVDVAVHYHTAADAADATAAAAGVTGARAVALGADLAVWPEGRALVDRAWEALGSLDIVVVNHGVWRPSAIDALTAQDYDATMDVNVRGAFAVTGRAVERMKAGGVRGRLVLVSSTSGQRGEPGYAHYAASKGALISLTKSLAPELAPAGILVNCVAPGWVKTPMTAAALADPVAGPAALATIPLGRAAEPDEIAAVVLFLAGSLATYVTGEVVNVNGGSVLAG